MQNIFIRPYSLTMENKVSGIVGLWMIKVDIVEDKATL